MARRNFHKRHLHGGERVSFREPAESCVRDGQEVAAAPVVRPTQQNATKAVANTRSVAGWQAGLQVSEARNDRRGVNGARTTRFELPASPPVRHRADEPSCFSLTYAPSEPLVPRYPPPPSPVFSILPPFAPLLTLFRSCRSTSRARGRPRHHPRPRPRPRTEESSPERSWRRWI